jgi:hypothetical protein
MSATAYWMCVLSDDVSTSGRRFSIQLMSAVRL